MGRQTTFNERDAAEIVDRLSKGEPLAAICRDDHMPTDRTVRNWKAADDAFASAIAGAREVGFDQIAAECLRIADTPLIGEERTTKDDGRVEVREGDMLGHRKLQIETRLKLLAKWDPKRYGDKVTQEISGPDGGAIPLGVKVEFVEPEGGE